MPQNRRREKREEGRERVEKEEDERIRMKPSWRRFFVEHIFSLVSITAAITILYFRPSLPIRVPFVDLDIFVATFLIVTSILLVMYSELRRNVEEYTITGRGVFEEVGYFDKRSTSLPFIKVERCEVEQTFLQRILGIGSIRVDAGNDYFMINSVAKPKKIRDVIRDRMAETMDGGRISATSD
ncbi:MAG: PH domain-containing protein [Candidatus Aenigmatarchaeota archaeon]